MLKDSPEVKAMEINAMTNTWSKSRRKRRLGRVKEVLPTSLCNKDLSLSETLKDKKDSALQDKQDVSRSETLISETDPTADCSKQSFNDVESTCDQSKSRGIKRRKSEDNESSDSGDSKFQKIEPNRIVLDDNAKKESFLYGSLIVQRQGDCSMIELCWLRGSGGRDAAHQVLQYFKNNLDT